MTITATLHADDKDLIDLGLTKKGDILSLRAFCKEKMNVQNAAEKMNEKKVLLQTILDQNKHKRRKEKDPNSSINSKRPMTKATVKKVQLGWPHYDEKQRRYVAIRQSWGGGTREVSLPLDTSLDSIIESAKQLFFPEGSSPLGLIEDMETHLANYKQDIIEDITVNDRVLPFTLEGYMQATKLPKVRLYLATKQQDKTGSEDDTKKKQEVQEIPDDHHHSDDHDSDHDDVFSLPYFDLVETQNLKAAQDREYEESLKIDRAKSEKEKEQLMAEIRQVEQQEKIQQMRLERVPSDPGKGDDSVQIQIRHITLGLIKRYFLKSENMLAVYDWVGSHSLLPPYFQLSSFDGHVYTPEESVVNGSNCTLNMTETESNPGIDDEDIEFIGFGSNETTLSNADTDNDVSIPTYGECSTSRMDYDDPGQQFRQVTLPRMLEEQGITLEEHSEDEEQVLPHFVSVGSVNANGFVIHRTRIKDDLIDVFKKSKPSRNAYFRIIDDRGKMEEGEGVGVTRDIFSTFWQQAFSSLTVGDAEKVPVIRHDYQHDEWKAMGDILVYGVQNLQFFPLGLSKAFIASCLFGEKTIDNDYLLASFRNYITPDEREVFDKVLQGAFSEVDNDDFLDFLGNYKCYKLPTNENVRAIMSELAHQEIIQRPRYIAQCWSEALSSLKEEGFKTPQDISSLYEEMRPTNKKVIRALQASPSNDAERQSLDFLKKFIRSLDTKSLEAFLKFTTGSFTMMNAGLSISFTNMDGLARRPIAHTCGPVLEIPSTYQSYPELAEEFTSILREKGAWGFNIV